MNLIEIEQREELPDPDSIELEASGVADPNGIIAAALTNPAIRLDGSVIVVDAETKYVLAEDSLTKRLFHNQLSTADLIVISKVEVFDKPGRVSARDWLNAKYPNKPLIEAVNRDSPVELVSGIDTQRDFRAEPSLPTDHAHDFESLSFTLDEPLDGDRLQAFLIRSQGHCCALSVCSTWLKIPIQSYFADWTQSDMEELWA
jgi:G3E family GTPase